MLVRPAERIYRTWFTDSRRWDHYRPRPTDIVIATYPKCGTTWMQRIVSLLVFQSPAPRPVMQISAWIDRRFAEPIEPAMARIEAQDHRRFLKAHLPFDGLPIYDEVKYIHVARDGRDACLSFHNHSSSFTPEVLERLDRAGLEDETVGRPYPRIPADPAQHFHEWLTEGAVAGQEDRSPVRSFFQLERTWWAERHRLNVLLVHYNDLTMDRAGEMRRIADFLDISVPPDLWPELVEAAGFPAMRRDGEALMGSVAASFRDGGRSFFHEGRNERWRGVFRPEDVALYEARVEAELSPECAHWLARGRSREGARPAAGSKRLSSA
jgi:aryl sulfotransferase